MSAKLRPQQLAFCQEYLIDLNGTQAAIRAGYSKKAARQQASHLLSKPAIQAEIQRLMDARAESTEIDARYVLRQAKQLHERCMQEVEPITERDEDGNIVQAVDDEGRAVFKFDSAGAARALEIVGRHIQVQAFKDNVEITDSTDLVERMQRAAKRKTAAAESSRSAADGSDKVH